MVYARRILGLTPLEPLLRDPGAAERGNLFHDIVRRFTETVPTRRAPGCAGILVAAGRAAFAAAALPADIEAVWWPRFLASAENILVWERNQRAVAKRRLAEVRAEPLAIGDTGIMLSGYADRIDLLPAGRADILDYKTGSSPSKAQAHTLIAPQLALEGALLMRGAFTAVGQLMPDQLAYVRLRANGKVEEESDPRIWQGGANGGRDFRRCVATAGRAAASLPNPAHGYLSRALPFREGEIDGDYDHLARVLEWSAGGDDEPGEAE